MKRIIALYALLPLLLTSCLEDKSKLGNSDINMVTFDIPKTVIIPFNPGVYTFDLMDHLTQTHAKDNSNLTFKWVWDYEAVSYAVEKLRVDDILTTESFVTIEMGELSEFEFFDNYYRADVTDNLTGITYHLDIHLKVRNPYEGAWMVLHDKGGSKVGMLSFNGAEPYKLDYDTFGTDGAEALTGKPVALGVFLTVPYLNIPPYYDGSLTNSFDNVFFVVTDDPQSAAVYAPLSKFGKVRRIAELVKDQNLLTSEKLAKTTYIYGTQNYMSMVIDGRLYHSRAGLRFYEAPIDANAVPGDYYISQALKFSTLTLLYDETGRRILYFLNTKNTGTAIPADRPDSWDDLVENQVNITNIDRAADDPSGYVNPIPDDRELIYFGQGPNLANSNQTTTAFAIALGKDGKSYVYQFNRGYDFETAGTKLVLSVNELDTPEGLTKDSKFASSVMFNGVIFYSSGNKIYRFDYLAGRGRAALIYEHPTGGEIGVMKFARSEKFSNGPKYTEYSYDVTYSLGVGINNGGKGEFVVLELATSGYITPFNGTRDSQTVIPDFGTIKDIVFL